MDAWELIESGKFEEACVAADLEYAADSCEISLNNKVKALLGLKKYEESIELCKKVTVLTIKYPSDCEFKMLGVSYWLQQKYQDAILAWQEGIGKMYTDAAGGVEVPLLLYYASVRTQDEKLRAGALKKLKKISKGRAMVNFPGPLADFVLGNISENELLNLLSTHPILRSRDFCKAAFHIGVKRLLAGDEAGCLQSMKESCSQFPTSRLESEFYLASHECENAGVAPQYQFLG